MKPSPPRAGDDIRIDAVLARLAARAIPKQGPGSGAPPSSDIRSSRNPWNKAVAFASIGPEGISRRRLESLREDLEAFGAQLSPADHLTPWIAADVSLGRPGKDVVDATRLAAFDALLRQLLSGDGTVGYHLETSRGLLLPSGPFGGSVELGIGAAPAICAGEAARGSSAAERLAPLGVEVGEADASGVHRVALPVDSRGWLVRGWDGIAGAVRSLVGGELAIPGALSATAFAGPVYRQRGGATRRGRPAGEERTREAGEIRILQERDVIHVRCQVPDSVWVYLVVQSGCELDAPLGNAPWRCPGDDRDMYRLLEVDDVPAVERPLLLMGEEPIPGLMSLLTRVNQDLAPDAEARAVALSRALGERWHVAEIGRFAHGLDPMAIFEAACRGAQEALEAASPAEALAALSPALQIPFGEGERAALLILRAQALRVAGDRDEAHRLLAEARALGEAVGLPGVVGDAERGLASLYADALHLSAAAVHFARAGQDHLDAGDRRGVAQDHRDRALALLQLGRLSEARAACHQALSMLDDGDALIPSIRAALRRAAPEAEEG